MENQETQQIRETPQAGAPGSEAEPVLNHDGIGLELEQVRNLLVRTHGEKLGKDDPILMTVTILNAFLGELAKVNARHHQALVKVMSASTDKYIAEVKQGIDALTKELSSVSISTIKDVMEQEEVKRQAHAQTVKWASAIVTISALVNIVLLVFK